MIASVAKCHNHHEMFTNENNEHIRGSLMLIADTQWKCPTRYSDWYSEMSCRRKPSHDFFWLWTVLSNATVSVTCVTCHPTVKWKLISAHNWDDQGWDSKSWWINYMLDDILFSTQLIITYLVTTISVGDVHNIFGIYLACGHKQQNKYAFSLCLVWLSVGWNRARNLAHFVS